MEAEPTQIAKILYTTAIQVWIPKDGLTFRSVSDTVKADTISYAWKDKDRILIKEKPADTPGLSLQLQNLRRTACRQTGTDNSWYPVY